MSFENLKPPPIPPKPSTLKVKKATNLAHPQVGSANYSSEIKPEMKRLKSVSFSDELTCMSDEEEDDIQVEVEDGSILLEDDTGNMSEFLHRTTDMTNRSTLAPPLPSKLKEPSPINSNVEDTSQIEVSDKEAEGTVSPEHPFDLPPKLPPRGLNDKIHLLEITFQNTALRGLRSTANPNSLPPPRPLKSEKRDTNFNFETPKEETKNSIPASIFTNSSSASSRDAKCQLKKKKSSLVRPAYSPPPPPLACQQKNSDPPDVNSSLVETENNTLSFISTKSLTDSNIQQNFSRLSLQSDLSAVKNKMSPELIIIARDLLNCEKKYMEHIQEGIEISKFQMANRFKDDNIAAKTIHKFFGFFGEIYGLHEQLYEDLKVQVETPKQIACCFLKHVLIFKFSAYIERQWMVPHESNLEDFEKFLLESQNLKPYLNITQEKIAEYLKKLQYLQSICDEENGLAVVQHAVMAVEGFDYQLKMVEELKKIDDVEDKVRDCGKVLLNRTFKVSVNGNKRKPYLIYLCEKKIIFTALQSNGVYQYVDGILVSACYCSQKSRQSGIFEIGIIDRKRFIIKAESQIIKQNWCTEIRKVLREDQFQD